MRYQNQSDATYADREPELACEIDALSLLSHRNTREPAWYFYLINHVAKTARSRTQYNKITQLIQSYSRDETLLFGIL